MGSKLSGKVAIVTGAGQGIGRGIAMRFADEGARVVVSELNADTGERTLREIKDKGGEAIFVQTDISDSESVENMVAKTVERFGEINILVNNAAMTGGTGVRSQPFFDTDLEKDWKRVIDVNLTGTFICSYAVAKRMAEAGHGGIILSISSIAGIIATWGSVSYGVSKAGVIMLAKCLAGELAPYNIRVNCIAPGPIIHDDGKWDPGGKPDPDTTSILVGRYGYVKDIAETALFLVSDEASFINGQTVSVDGGISVRFRPGGRRRK